MTPERFKHIVKELDFDKLDDRETEFIQSCERRMKMMGDLSEPMESWLEDIFAKNQW